MFPSSLIHVCTRCTHGTSESRTGAVLSWIASSWWRSGVERGEKRRPIHRRSAYIKPRACRSADPPTGFVIQPLVREGVRGAVESGDVVRSRRALLLLSSSLSSSLSPSSKRTSHDESSRDHSLPGTS